jgi:hypothetical protein
LFVGAYIGPLVGLGITVSLDVDPPGTSLYETTANIAAALLLAFLFQNGRFAATHHRAHWALSLHVGSVVGIAEAMSASLWALGRDDGSPVLAGLAIGGLIWGLVLLITSTTVALWPSAAVAGALGEDEVVGGGEGGREGAEEDGVGAEC